MIYTVGLARYPVMAHRIIAGSLPVTSQGFSYLLVLGFVLAVLLSLGVTSEHILLTHQREKEAELIFVGKQYQNAIASYYQKSPNGLSEFPLTLESLINDQRSLTSQHHLRKLYKDPISNTLEWGLVKNSLGRIVGVYSLSSEEPIKKNVDFLPASVTKVESYADWKFVYVPDEKNAPVTGEAVNDNATFLEGFGTEELGENDTDKPSALNPFDSVGENEGDGVSVGEQLY